MHQTNKQTKNEMKKILTQTIDIPLWTLLTATTTTTTTLTKTSTTSVNININTTTTMTMTYQYDYETKEWNPVKTIIATTNKPLAI